MKRRLLVYAAPLLFCIVACVQRYMVHMHHLDTWKGGGFGMFSAISARSMRALTVALVMPDGEVNRFPPGVLARSIPLDGDMRLRRAQILTMPSAARVRQLARELADAEWVAVMSQDTAESEADRPIEYYRMKQDLSEDVESRSLALKEIRVEVWQYHLDAESSELILTNLITVSEPIDRG